MLSYNLLKDEELAIKLRDGDQNAFAALFDRYFGLLFVHSSKMLSDDDEAKDIVQELFEGLWKSRESLQISTRFSSYVYAALRNRIINHIAHKKVVGRYVDSLSDFMQIDNCTADHRIRTRELSLMIEKEISALPQKMQEVFRLSRKEHLSYKEISAHLNISEQTVRSHVKKALRILRPKLTTVAYLYLLSQLS